MTTWTKTTRERYWEMLEVLPPEVMTGAGFLVGEPWDHDANGRPRFSAFVCKGDPCERSGPAEFFEAAEPMTVAAFKAIALNDVKEAA